MKTVPLYCRPEAFELFASQVNRLGRRDGLLLAATAVAMHALDDVEPQHVVDRIDALAGDVLSRCRTRDPQALLAHLHEVLFEEQGFHGNSGEYYSPLNSYLPAVLESKIGLPLTLALVYKSVGERVGLRIEGVNSPGHFLARVYVGCDVMIVDPFHRGQVLSPLEALNRIAAVFHEPLCSEMSLLATATPAMWLARLLGNLRCVFACNRCQNDLAAMNELISLLRHGIG